MSLLETRNKKFNIPFVFIAGVIFLVALAYFAKYLESYNATGLRNLELPEVSETNVEVKSVSVRLAKNAVIYLDSQEINNGELEEILKKEFEGHANPVIQLQAEEGVSIDKVVKVMDIANKNQYKVILKAQ
ncbi:biopolymer transporter ExbD [Kordia algicida OT-1]|uniref:Biopolymer transport protein ExbD/TolR n=1 Tax=Kordia algicida OT-1 TaxID=391587 RepID=A9DMC7_9FLAO|nr:biopolymer transporter ExbD [Kordia algicida]EDP97676.1 hypothetical protein KAOT1_20977 [Kordia algicida OT-1]